MTRTLRPTIAEIRRHHTEAVFGSTGGLLDHFFRQSAQARLRDNALTYITRLLIEESDLRLEVERLRDEVRELRQRIAGEDCEGECSDGVR